MTTRKKKILQQTILEFPNKLYNPCVRKSLPALVFLLAIGTFKSWAGDGLSAETQQQAGDQPKVKVNVLNVCTPSADEQAAFKNVFSKVAGNPALADDFEIARGRTSVTDEPSSRFVRLRRDMAAQSPLLTAQYSMSTDEQTTVETLVLRLRDTKEFYELSIEDRVSASAASPLAVVTADTPASRIRIERLAKSSIVLARCESADQSVYEPLFKQATDLAALYRSALGLRSAFKADIAWLAAPAKSGTSTGARKRP